MSGPQPIRTDGAIDLWQPAVERAPAEVRSALFARDASQDGFLDFFEAQSADLVAPLTRRGFSILSADDLRDYEKILLSAAITEPLMGPFAKYPRCTWRTAEEWVLDEAKPLRERPPLISWKTGGLDLLTIQTDSSSATLLMRQKTNVDGGGFYFTLRLDKSAIPDNADLMTIEINGTSVPLSRFVSKTDSGVVTLRRNLLAFFFNAIEKNAGLIPKARAAEYRDYLDALCFQTPATQMREYTAADAERKDSPEHARLAAAAAAAAARVENNSSPAVYTFMVRDNWQPYRIDLRCDSTVQKPLAAAEVDLISAVMEDVPPNLYGALAIGGVMQGFSVEIVDDAVLTAMTGNPGFIGAYLPDRNKFVIRRSALKSEDKNVLSDIVRHELAHGLFPTDSTPYNAGDFVKLNPNGEWLTSHESWLAESNPNYFIQDYFDAVVKKAKTAKRLPSVSVYSLHHLGEFVAECVSAYLEGETNDHPWQSMLHGPMSRAELREKLPEMYLAIKLFLEPDNAYFGDLHIFSWESKAVLDEMLRSDQAEFALDADTTGVDLAELYEKTHASLVR